LNKEFKKKGKISLFVYVIVVVLIILAGILSYIIYLPDEFVRNKDIATSRCIDLCFKSLGESTDLSGEGPCLSNQIATGWVCDVVHDPRVSLIDDKTQNQCSEYTQGMHFVEISPECKVLRVK